MFIDKNLTYQKSFYYLDIDLQPASHSKFKESSTSNLHSFTSGGNQKHIFNVMSKSIPDSDTVQSDTVQSDIVQSDTVQSDTEQSDTVQSFVRKQSLLCSENLNSNNSIDDSVKISTYDDSTSKKVKQIVSIKNSKTKNLTVLEKVRSKSNLYKRSYENKQRKSLPQTNSAKVADSFEETNFVQFEKTVPNSPKNSFVESSPAGSNSSDDVRSESDFIENKKKCKKTVSSNKQISLQINEISSKLDISIANQMKLMAFLLPHEREMIRPHNLPALPLKSVNDFWKFEKYLKDPENMSAMVSCADI